MEQFILSFLLATFTIHPLSLLAQPTTTPESQITVEGNVYCDPCFKSEFTKYSYFMPGVDVHIQCKLKVNPPGTAEIITISVNRTTDRHGVFRLEIPHVDGVDCVEGPPIQFSCQALLIRSSSSSCNVPAVHTTTYQLSIKSKQANQCVYSFPGMSFRPTDRNDTLCGKRVEELSTSLKHTKVYSLHHGFRHPRFPLPKPKPSSLKFPFGFPLPRKPFNPSIPFVFSPPPPPAFSLEDPRTWFPHNPLQIQSPPPPPPPRFNPWDPRTWSPRVSPPPSGPLYEKP